MQPDAAPTPHPDVIEPGAWLLAYWMGRYHGYISPPTVTDAALLKVERTPEAPQGANLMQARHFRHCLNSLLEPIG